MIHFSINLLRCFQTSLDILQKGCIWELNCPSESLQTFSGASLPSNCQNVSMSPSEITAGDPPEDSLLASGWVDDVSSFFCLMMKYPATTSADSFSRNSFWIMSNGAICLSSTSHSPSRCYSPDLGKCTVAALASFVAGAIFPFYCCGNKPP